MMDWFRRYDVKCLRSLLSVTVEVLQKIQERVKTRDVIKVLMSQEDRPKPVEVVLPFEQVPRDAITSIDEQVPGLMGEKNLGRNPCNGIQNFNFDHLWPALLKLLSFESNI